jgi:hypothetical protein
MSEGGTVKFWRITISSGRGEGQLRNAALVKAAKVDESRNIPIPDLQKGLAILDLWSKEHPRDDWVLMPIDFIFHWPEQGANDG